MFETKMKPLKDLDLLDRFLFDNVMENPEACQDILSICLGMDIPEIVSAQKEKTFELSNALRSIRLDIFSFDEENTIYNAEMQRNNTYNLCKRSRYYQAHLDVSLLEPGDIDFNKLNDSYMIMIMIMPFDLFGKQRYRYTFENRCIEDSSIRLQDGATKIFLNTKGCNQEEVSEELIQFLAYVENSSELPAQATDMVRLKRIHAQVHRVKKNEELGVKYMQEWEEKAIIKKGATETGIHALIESFQELGISQEDTVAKICDKFSLDSDTAMQYVTQYWVKK